MKKLTCLFLFVTTALAFGQSLQNQVIGASGSTITVGNTTLNYTIAETIASVKTDGTNTLQQGFQQGFNLSGIYWNGSIGTDWANGNNWNGGIVPQTNDKAIIVSATNNPIFDTSLHTIKNLEVKSGGDLTINSGKTLTVTNDFDNQGILTVNSSATQSGSFIVQGTSTGNLLYSRGGLLANKWSIIAPPVKNQKIVAFAQNLANDIRKNTTVSPNRYAVGFYNDANTSGSKWVYFNANTNVNTTFDTAKGYTVSRNSNGEIAFTGALEVNDVAKSTTVSEWNAIGNPYTAYYPINKNSNSSFLNDNSANLEIPSVYIWSVSQEKYVAVTNLVSSTEQFLPPAQGFFIKTNSSVANMHFKANKRSAMPSSGTHDFNKTETEKTPYVKVFAAKGNVKINTDIIFSKKATLGFDTNEDIENFTTANFDLNSYLVDNSMNKNFTIQSIPESSISTAVIPLSIEAKANDNIVFTTKPIDFPSEAKLYLEDKLTSTFTRLDEENSTYEVTLTENTSGIGRFYLHTSSRGLSTIDTDMSTVSIFKLDTNFLQIKGQTKNARLTMFDMIGKQVYKNQFDVLGEKNINLSTLANGVYLINLETDKGNITKKIRVD